MTAIAELAACVATSQKLQETRAAAKRLLGDQYAEIVGTAKMVVRACMLHDGCAVLEAASKLCERHGNANVVYNMIVFAAAVEIISDE